MNKFRVALITGILILPDLVFARTWHDRAGRRMTGDFVRVHNGRIVLRRTGGAVVTVDFGDLVESDQEFLREELESRNQGDLLPPREPAEVQSPNNPGQPAGAQPAGANPGPVGAPPPAPAAPRPRHPLSVAAEAAKQRTEQARAQAAESQRRYEEETARRNAERDRLDQMRRESDRRDAEMKRANSRRMVWKCATCGAEYDNPPSICSKCNRRVRIVDSPPPGAAGVNQSSMPVNSNDSTGISFRGMRLIWKLGVLGIVVIGAAIGAISKR